MGESVTTGIFLIFGLSILPDGVQGVFCLACEGYARTEDCEYVTKCGPHESCQTELFISPGGIIKYNMRCKDDRQCSASAIFGKRSESVVCSECCSGHLCNGNLCNGHGYALNSTANRGPICTQCVDQVGVDKCDVITTCGRDEVCMVSWDTKRHTYSSGCQKKTYCDTRYGFDYALYGTGRKRSSQEVFYNGKCLIKCCTDDLCNTECGSHSSSSNSQHTSSSPIQGGSNQTPLPTMTSSKVPIATASQSPLISSRSTITTLAVFTPAPTLTTNLSSILSPTKATINTATNMSSTASGGPCQNNACVYGTCVATSTSYTCSCIFGAFGRYCDQRIDMCTFQPCLHGTCKNDSVSPDGYICTCSMGYSGKDCEIASG